MPIIVNIQSNAPTIVRPLITLCILTPSISALYLNVSRESPQIGMFQLRIIVFGGASRANSSLFVRQPTGEGAPPRHAIGWLIWCIHVSLYP